jgi:hypothetical protein
MPNFAPRSGRPEPPFALHLLGAWTTLDRDGERYSGRVRGGAERGKHAVVDEAGDGADAVTGP